ncbi:MAG: shikimate kinase [Deltaproteobacteria bacterium]|nr:shikimate kinase [Deltaproteobacteria bacterium]
MAVFVGFMGAGKSSVGKEVARRLEAEFVDVDERIAAEAGRSISEIFSSEGEGAFRAMEREAISEVVSRPGRVVAVGGGAFLDAANRRILKAYAPVFFLDVSAETARERLAGDRSRPLLPPDSAKIEAMMAQRAPSYAEADFRIAAEGRSVEEVADEVERHLGRRRGRPG